MEYKQVNGKNSTNQQAEEIINNYGLSYSEVKEIALDVFKNNFLQLSKEASDIVMARANQLIDDFLKKLQEENLLGISECKNPDFQYILYEAGKSYARTGEKDQENLLINLLVERTKQTSRSLLQIVLDESIQVVQKLTYEQINILSVLFLLNYTRIVNPLCLADIFKNWDKHLIPLIQNLTSNYTNIQHLSYASCGTETIDSRPLASTILQSYPGFFSEGFTQEAWDNLHIQSPIAKSILKQNDQLFHLSFANEDDLKEFCKKNNISDTDEQKLCNLLSYNIIDEIKCKQKIIQEFPQIKSLFDIYEDAGFEHFRLSSVGIAIGYSNIKQYDPTFTDLSIWIK